MRRFRTDLPRLFAALVLLGGTVVLPLVHQLEHALGGHEHGVTDADLEDGHYGGALALARGEEGRQAALAAEFDSMDFGDALAVGDTQTQHTPDHHHHGQPGAPHGEGSLLHHAVSLAGAPATLVFTVTADVVCIIRPGDTGANVAAPERALHHPRGPPNPVLV